MISIEMGCNNGQIKSTQAWKDGFAKRSLTQNNQTFWAGCLAG
jgi:hypothetical protein